jgi:hypothetical protein
MFKKLLKKVYNPKTDKQRLLESIDEQYDIIHQFQEYKANSDEAQELIDINVEQLQENIKDLSKTFGGLLNPLKNKHLSLKEYIELLRYKIPMRTSGFCVSIEANINTDNPEFVISPEHTFYAKPTSYDRENYRTKINILNHRKLTPKFEKLFYKKLKEKIGASLKYYDEDGFAYIKKNEIDLIEQVDLIQFQRSTRGNYKSKNLAMGIVKDEFNGLWEYLVECSNLNQVFIFTKKKDLNDIKRYSMSYVDIMVFGILINVWMVFFDLIYGYFNIIPRNPIQDKIRIKSLKPEFNIIRIAIPFSGILNSMILINEFKKYQRANDGSDILDFYKWYFEEIR